MRQFDVLENPSAASRIYAPFLVVLQSHFLMAMPTVIVAPLLPEGNEPPYTEVTVPVEFSGRGYMVSVAEMTVIDARVARRAVGSLVAFEDTLRRAIDRVVTGF